MMSSVPSSPTLPSDTLVYDDNVGPVNIRLNGDNPGPPLCLSPGFAFRARQPDANKSNYTHESKQN